MQDCPDMADVFVEHLGKDEDVIQKQGMVQHTLQDIDDQCLKKRQGISQTKGHDQVFVVASGGVECHLPAVPLPDTDQMVGVAQIQLGEKAGPLEKLEHRGHEG